MLISKTLVSLLKHTLACESLHSFLYIIRQKYHQQYIVRTERFFVKKTAFILISPIKFNGSVTDQSHAQDNSAVTLNGLNISKMADGMQEPYAGDGSDAEKFVKYEWTLAERQAFSEKNCNG